MATWTAADVRRHRTAIRTGAAGQRVDDGAAPLPGGGFVLTLRDLPPSLNDWQRWHWTRRRVETLRLAAIVRAVAVSARLPRLGAAEARVRCYFPDRRRRDPTNYAHWKPLWDALVRAGVLDDDDAAHLRVAAFDLLVDRERPRSEVDVRPLSPPRGSLVPGVPGRVVAAGREVEVPGASGPAPALVPP